MLVLAQAAMEGTPIEAAKRAVMLGRSTRGGPAIPHSYGVLTRVLLVWIPLKTGAAMGPRFEQPGGSAGEGVSGP